jgi:hypothetical protein
MERMPGDGRRIEPRRRGTGSTIRATLRSFSAASLTRPKRSTPRKSGPDAIPADLEPVGERPYGAQGRPRGVGNIYFSYDADADVVAVRAAVVTRRETAIAHVGEHRALLLRDGRPRELVVPHTLWFLQGHERRARMDTNEAAFAQDVALQALGLSDTIAIDVLRSPGAPGDRLVIGNGGPNPASGPGAG